MWPTRREEQSVDGKSGGSSARTDVTARACTAAKHSIAKMLVSSSERSLSFVCARLGPLRILLCQGLFCLFFLWLLQLLGFLCCHTEQHPVRRMPSHLDLDPPTTQQTDTPRCLRWTHAVASPLPLPLNSHSNPPSAMSLPA